MKTTSIAQTKQQDDDDDNNERKEEKKTPATHSLYINNCAHFDYRPHTETENECERTVQQRWHDWIMPVATTKSLAYS